MIRPRGPQKSSHIVGLRCDQLSNVLIIPYLLDASVSSLAAWGRCLPGDRWRPWSPRTHLPQGLGSGIRRSSSVKGLHLLPSLGWAASPCPGWQTGPRSLDPEAPQPAPPAWGLSSSCLREASTSSPHVKTLPKPHLL